jgi:hypothetical protein
MEISEDTQKVINYLQYYSNNSLRKAQDVALILEINAERNDYLLANQIIFTGKSIWNLHRTLRRSDGSRDISLLEKEILSSFKEIQKLLSKFINYAEKEQIKRFEEVYLQETAGCLRNIIDLSHDLSILKEVQTEQMKEKKKGN